VIFNENLCRIAEQYLKKGSKVFIEGQLQTRKWQDQAGQDRYSTEVVLQGFRGELTLLDRAGGAGGSGGDLGSDDAGGEFGSAGPTRKVAAAAGAGARGSRGDMDDEIPFLRIGSASLRAARRTAHSRASGNPDRVRGIRASGFRLRGDERPPAFPQ
jgi:hypothetical protein